MSRPQNVPSGPSLCWLSLQLGLRPFQTIVGNLASDPKFLLWLSFVLTCRWRRLFLPEVQAAGNEVTPAAPFFSLFSGSLVHLNKDHPSLWIWSVEDHRAAYQLLFDSRCDTKEGVATPFLWPGASFLFVSNYSSALWEDGLFLLPEHRGLKQTHQRRKWVCSPCCSISLHSGKVIGGDIRVVEFGNHYLILLKEESQEKQNSGKRKSCFVYTFVVTSPAVMAGRSERQTYISGVGGLSIWIRFLCK